MPDISVIIAAYNAEKFIEESIKSALSLSQTGEVLVMDDASTDRTFDICQALATADKRVQLFQSKKNRGWPTSRNELLKKAKCDYIVFLDADDYFLPNRFDTALKIMESDLSIDGVYEGYENFYEDEEKQLEWLQKKKNTVDRLHAPPSIIAPENLFQELMSVGLHMGPTAMQQLVFRSTLFHKVPYFDEDVRSGADTITVIQIAATCRIVCGQNEYPVYMRRIHQNNIFGGKTDRGFRGRRHLKIFKRVWEWANTYLDEEGKQLVNLYLVNKLHEFYPLLFLDVPPRFITAYIRKTVRLFLQAQHFPHLLLQRIFWQKILPTNLISQ